MTGYRITSAAEDELVESTAYYSEVSFGLAQDFINDFDRRLHLIRRYPDIGQPLEGEFKSIPFAKFPFSLIYRIDDDKVLVILAVHHHSRRPDRWRSRIS